MEIRRKKIIDVFYGIRIFPSLIACLMTLAGLYLAMEMPDKITAITATLSMFLLTSAALALNDYLDRDIDKINIPSRPIPIGKVSPKHMLFYAIMGFILVLISNFFLGVCPFLYVVVTVFLTTIYTRYIKKITLLKSIYAGVQCGSVPLYAGLVAGNLDPVIMPSVLASLILIGRELIMDLRDIDGDKKIGIITLPVKFGPEITRISIIILHFLMMVASTLYIYSNITNIIGLIFLSIYVLLFYPIFTILLKKHSMSKKKLQIAIILPLIIVTLGFLILLVSSQ